MARSPKQYSGTVQLVLLVSLYIGSLLLLGLASFAVSALFTGSALTDLQQADLSDPKIILAWKVITFLDPVFLYLLPAFLFARIVAPGQTDWLDLNKPVRLKPAIFVIIILLLANPMSGLLYDWNYTWGMAQSSIQRTESMIDVGNAIMKMPNFGYLLLNLLLFALIPAIARECFFRGILQQVLVRMMPKAPWFAIIIASVIFSACFFQWQWFASMILIGIILGVIYYLTENLWLSILADFISSSENWFQSYFYQRQWSNEDPYHPSATPWYTALICLLLTVGLLWYFRKSIPKPVVKMAFQEDIESIGK
ncbi:CPBP family intramembrane glutamic endopeptidase [Chitinophaga filiformis]|uniref:CPBP family intramembrane metalloprotease n=1 Tax=Chitinophaga filiformis TaxID=104663 RepID=A0ABY4HUF3_CHIFI|nr:CPBP family intramembrane glutamic endopeptidase [Chitinophaga filiformis]UPK67416.1 CPBP family intramembrane metalloprotease [Chitinophaga filiformis]